MPMIPNWECDEKTCKLKVEDLTSVAKWKLDQKLYDLEVARETRATDNKRRDISRIIEELNKGYHVDKLKRDLEKVSSDIVVNPVGENGNRFFYEVTIPNNVTFKKNAEKVIDGIQYAKGYKTIKKTKIEDGDPVDVEEYVAKDKRRAFRPMVKLTCHKQDDDWDQDRIDKMTPESVHDPSRYSHLPDMKNSLIVVHTVDLANQWREEMSKDIFLDIPEEEIGQIGGGRHDLCQLSITTYQSLMKPYIQDALKGRIGLLVVDETHHGSADQWNKGIKGLDVKQWKVDQKFNEDRGDLKDVIVPDEYLPADDRPYKLGLSATPAPYGPKLEERLSSVLGEKLVDVKDSTIVDAGYILPVRMRRKKIEPQEFTKSVHDAAWIINADASAHLNDVKATKWNANLGDISNLYNYKMGKDEVSKTPEYKQSFNARGVMFDAATMDENKMKTVMERIAQDPDDNFIVYSPRVLPLYFISRGVQTSGIDPIGCRVKLGVDVDKSTCLLDDEKKCMEVTVEVDGENINPCTWSRGTLPLVGKGSSDLTKRKNVYDEMRKSIREAKDEAKAGVLIEFISEQFDKLKDPGVSIDDKEKIVDELISDKMCSPNIKRGVTFTEELREKCKAEDPCGDLKTMETGKEISACDEFKLVDPAIGIFPKKAKRSITIAEEKLHRVKKIIESVKSKGMYESTAQDRLQHFGLDKDANILKGLSDKLSGQAGLKKKLAEIMTGSLVDEFLWRNLDHITIDRDKVFEEWLQVGRINYDNLVDYGKKRRIPITQMKVPGATYPFPLGLFTIWGERPPGPPSVINSRFRSIISGTRHVLSSAMRDAVNRSEFDLATFFREMKRARTTAAKKKRNSEIIKDYSEGRTRVLPTTFTEGIDIPSANNLIVASHYTKPKDIIQLTGRIKRVADGKEPGESLFTTLRGTIDEQYFRSAMRNLITDVYHTEHGEEMIQELNYPALKGGGFVVPTILSEP